MDKSELSDLVAGNRILVVSESEEKVKNNFAPEEYGPFKLHFGYNSFTCLQLGVLGDTPRKRKDGMIQFPMRRHLKKRIQRKFSDITSILPDSFYAFNLRGYNDNPLQAIPEFYRRWKVEQRSIVGIDFKIFIGEEADKLFWYPDFFKDDSCLDLSYVIALKRLGVQIPETMKKQYREDMEKYGGPLRRLLRQKKQEPNQAQSASDELNFLFSI